MVPRPIGHQDGAVSSIWTIRRSTTEAKVAGLCSGVAQHWNVDPVLVRVGCALLAVSGGVGIVLYLAGWLLIPTQGSDKAPIEELLGVQVRSWPREAVIAVVVLGCLAAFSAMSSVTSVSLWPAVVLAGLWYVGYRRNRTEPGAPPPVAPAPETSADRSAFLAHPDPVGLYAPPPADPPRPVVRGRHSRSARRLRVLGCLVTGLCLAGLGAADAAGLEVPAAAYLATALLVVGLTLVAATWLGRARGILPVGLVLAVATAVATIGGPIAERQHWGTEYRSYTAVTSLPNTADSLDVGELSVDLRGLPIEQNVAYAAHVDVGRLEVRVPADANVRVRYRVKSGLFVGYDTRLESGAAVTGVMEPARAEAGTPTLTLDLSVDRGQIEVSR